MFVKHLKKFTIAGVEISAINMDYAVSAIDNIIRDAKQGYICVCPASVVVSCYKNKQLQKVVNSAYLATPDGMPLVWIGRIKGFRGITRVYGPDLMEKTLELAEKEGHSNFFYGSKSDVLEKLKKVLCRKFPGLKIAGYYSPPFRDLTPEEDKEITDMINRSAADIVWVGIGNPRQEIWMAEHLGKIKASVMIGVGAAFDFIAGSKPQAPKWMRDNGLEWLFRFLSEPKRLWRRYLIGNFLFLYLFFKEVIKTKFLTPSKNKN